MKTAPILLAAAAWLAGGLLAPTPAWALYKVVGPDGSVTYTDRAPPAAAGRVVAVRRDGGAAPDPALPAALREPVARFPVVLYTATECNACDLGRDLLRQRGVPFQERQASSDEDRDAWVRLVGGTEAPVMMVGQQALRGYTPAAWNETLDVAGYPRRSVLPPNYQPPPAVPLVARAAAPTTVVAPRARAVDPAPETTPGGIRF